MKTNSILLLLSFIFYYANSHSQNNKAFISNVNMKLLNDKVLVSYDISKSSEKDTFNINLDFITNSHTYVYPKTLNGDFGNKVSGGLNKEILWDIRTDEDLITNKLKPNLYLDNVEVGDKFGGPSNAFLSLLVPGLGDYYVYDHKEMIFKPYLKTAFVLTTIAIGLKALNYRHRDSVWIDTHIDYRWIDIRGFYEYKPVEIEGRYSEGGIDYYMFRGDAELFLGLGAAVWAIDIFWVALKGAENKIRYNNKLKDRKKLSFKASATNISLAYRF